MELDFEKIIQLKRLRVEKSCLSEKEMKLSTPIYTDRRLIDTFHSRFTQLMQDKGIYNHSSVSQRQKFLIVIMFLFSPSTLAGGKMPKGLRDYICKVMGLKSASAISHDLDNVVFLYQNYTDFRDDVNEIFRAITKDFQEKVN